MIQSTVFYCTHPPFFPNNLVNQATTSLDLQKLVFWRTACCGKKCYRVGTDIAVMLFNKPLSEKEDEMCTFGWLFVGHLIGDWLLQNDWMATGKRQGCYTVAGMLHYSIYTGSILIALFFSATGEYPPTFWLIAGTIVFASHWLIDATTVVDRWMHLLRQSDLAWLRIVIDQIAHILVLVVITLLTPGTFPRC